SSSTARPATAAIAVTRMLLMCFAASPPRKSAAPKMRAPERPMTTTRSVSTRDNLRHWPARENHHGLQYAGLADNWKLDMPGMCGEVPGGRYTVERKVGATHGE